MNPARETLIRAIIDGAVKFVPKITADEIRREMLDTLDVFSTKELNRQYEIIKGIIPCSPSTKSSDRPRQSPKSTVFSPPQNPPALSLPDIPELAKLQLHQQLLMPWASM
jgi:hypothetical protein